MDQSEGYIRVSRPSFYSLSASMFLLDLGSGGEEVKLLETQKFTSNFSGTNVKTQLHTVSKSDYLISRIQQQQLQGIR